MGNIQTDKMRFESLFDYINEHNPWLLASWLNTPEGKGLVWPGVVE
tara:strand:- start:543 stop:680 length:138 start_codon:yes stop_codon:yes gene_type:complete